MAKKTQDPNATSAELKIWFDEVRNYEREFRRWETRTEKIIRRYKDEKRNVGESNRAKFNILWSNVQILTAATFSRMPRPDVSRRFRDNDPVGRVASMILERALQYQIEHYPLYRSTLKASVQDRFLGGRGIAWVRYEPHFRAVDALTDGEQITDDIEEPREELDYECAEVDYVHWKDFGHSVARTWEEVPRVWRAVYMTKEAITERFGAQIAERVPMDASPKEVQASTDYRSGDSLDRAKIFEGWDKTTKEAVWFSKSLKDFIDRRDDPLGLENFWPCPRPLYSTLSTDSLVPVPDFTIYQDQANELDILCDRIDGLIKALQIKGVYDASIGELARLFTEAENNTLMPVKNWAAFAEKNGLKGAIDLVDLDPIARALREAYGAMEQVKNQVYELTGISDIIRGQTEASETATAQEIKGQYASLRLKTYQEEVARYATELLQIMAQIICGKFSPETILTISAAKQLSDVDQQLIPQAMALLLGPERLQNPDAPQGPNPLRDFRIEVAADTMIALDEKEEKQSRVEFLSATGGFIEQIAQVLAQTPPDARGPVVGLFMELLKFGAGAFKVGKAIEGAVDETAEILKKLAVQPPQPAPPPPEVQAEQIRQQGQVQMNQDRIAGENARQQQELAVKDQQHQREMGVKREIGLQDIAAKSKPQTQISLQGDMQNVFDGLGQSIAQTMQSNQQLAQTMQAFLAQMAELMNKMAAPRQFHVKRNPDGSHTGMAMPMMTQ